MTGPTSSVQPPSTFFSRNEVKLYTGAAVISLALCLISLGVIVAAAGTSPHLYYQMCVPNEPWLNSIPSQVKNAWDIQMALQYGVHVGLVALIPCIVGGVLFVLSMLARRQAMKKNQGPTEITPTKSTTEIKVEVWAERGKLACLILGFSIATFSVGLMIGSSLILNNGVPHVDALIKQGMYDYPYAHTYDSYWCQTPGLDDGHWAIGVGPLNFWLVLKSDWLVPTRNIMSGIVPVSVVGALGGAGLTAFGIFGKGAFNFVSAVYNKLRSHESENEKMISSEALL